MPESILQESTAYLNTTATDEPCVAVLCDLCKHGQPYTVRSFSESDKTHNLDSFEYGQLNLFCVPLGCGNKSCEIRTKVYAPKPPNVSVSDTKAELKLWTLSGIRCQCRAEVHVQQSDEPQQIRFDAGSGGGAY